ncbi:Sulfite exporter TauE/SafE [Candidatus Gugararchaeum adminiculabundum]|nr:Sulfite exporter TauE/SafE [Candidatus Gugararchaeum adminiculabundum]
MPDLIFYSLGLIVCLVAEFVDVMVAVSSVFTLPSLIILGVPIYTAIANNRFYTIFFSLAASLNYLKKKVRLNFRLMALFIVFRISGAYSGSVLLLHFSPDSIKPAIGSLLLLAMATILYLETRRASCKPGKRDESPSEIKLAIICFFVFVLGVYEGFVGGGVGTTSRLIFILLLCYTPLEAALAELVLTVFGSSVASIIPLTSGSIDFVLFIPMVLGGTIGALAGSSLALKADERSLRHLLFAVVGILIIKMLFF